MNLLHYPWLLKPTLRKMHLQEVTKSLPLIVCISSCGELEKSSLTSRLLAQNALEAGCIWLLLNLRTELPPRLPLTYSYQSLVLVLDNQVLSPVLLGVGPSGPSKKSSRLRLQSVKLPIPPWCLPPHSLQSKLTGGLEGPHDSPLQMLLSQTELLRCPYNISTHPFILHQVFLQMNTILFPVRGPGIMPQFRWDSVCLNSKPDAAMV